MSYFQELLVTTKFEQHSLLSTPLIQQIILGKNDVITLALYQSFLIQAYHHVRHTVPLLQRCRDRLSEGSFEHLHHCLPALEDYVVEEAGHDEWIIDDLVATGLTRDQALQSSPMLSTELMVAYAYHRMDHHHPLSLLGMVHVLEGSSVRLALMAADRIQEQLGLPDEAFRYLRSHGELDQQHTAHFELLIDSIDDHAAQQAIQQAAKRFYHLYGNIFREIAEQFAIAQDEVIHA